MAIVVDLLCGRDYYRSISLFSKLSATDWSSCCTCG
jgi:hypothetical protein